MAKYVTVRLKVIPPDDGPTANDAELNDAIESHCGYMSLDVDSEEHEDGTENWTVDEATVLAVEDDA